MFKEIKRTNQYHSFITIKLYSYTICKRENTVVAHFYPEYSDLIRTNKRIKNKYWPVPYTKITNNQTRGQEKTVTLLLSPKDFGVGDIFWSTFEGAQYLWRWGEWRGGAAKKGDKPSDLNSCLRLVEWLFGWKWRFAGWYFDANWKKRHFEGYMQ